MDFIAKSSHAETPALPCIQGEYDLLQRPFDLESPWTFWFDMYPGPGLSAEQYAAAMKKIGTVDTVQGFWQYFNNLPGLTELSPKSSYHLMKRDSSPLWEDRSNIYGGSLSFKIKKADTEKVWLHLLLGVIGEQFSNALHPEDDIQGVSINVRQGHEDAICFWNKNADFVEIPRLISSLRAWLPGVYFQEPVYRIHRQEMNVSNSASAQKSATPKGLQKFFPASKNISPPRQSPQRTTSPPKIIEQSYKKKLFTTPPKQEPHHQSHAAKHTAFHFKPVQCT